MANHGETKSQKRLSVAKVRGHNLQKKDKVFTLKSKAGPHSKETSVPLTFVLRNLLNLIKNVKEGKYALQKLNVKVNGVKRKDYKFPVGLFDIVEVEEIKKRYRLIYDSKGRIVPVEIDSQKELAKIVKVIKRKSIKGKKFQVALSDGTVLLEDKPELKMGSALKMELPSKKILGSYSLEKGNTAYVTSGVHVSQTGTIEHYTEATLRRAPRVKIKTKESEFETFADNVIVVGKNKFDIDIGE